MAPPAIAADQLFTYLGPLEFSITVEDLQRYGQTGKAPPLFKKTLAELEPQQAQQVQQLFATSINIDATRLSQFLYTPQGEMLLGELGQILQSESGLSGFHGLRASLFQAAKSGELTIPNVLKQFPGDRIRINQARLFELATAWERFNQQSQLAIANIAEHTVPALNQFSEAEQQELTNPGPFHSVITTELVTPAGDHADLYMPQQPSDVLSSKPFPVIVISHGLGNDSSENLHSNRHAFRYLAQHYASHGFAVVVPEHPLRHSSRGQIQFPSSTPEAVNPADAIFEHDWATKIVPQDFVQRPQSVSRLLDELERHSQADPLLQNRLNIQQVGILGQSFGGYGALALGGAVLDLDYLEQQCPADATRLNPSLVLQCRALGLSGRQQQFADARIKAVVALNPLGSALFGPEGMGAIEVPVLMLAGGQDRVTPALAEQIQPFKWLQVRDRYLMMMPEVTHFSLIEAADDLATKQLDQPQFEQTQSFLLGKLPAQARQELQAISLAFFRTHLAEQPRYRKFLEP